MHLGSSESTQEARVALGCASCNSNASLVLSKLPTCIHNSNDKRTLSMNQLLNFNKGENKIFIITNWGVLINNYLYFSISVLTMAFSSTPWRNTTFNLLFGNRKRIYPASIINSIRFK